MNHYVPTLALAGLLLGAPEALAAEADTTPTNTLDLSRYLGEWHETARFDNVFERGLHDVTALYEKLADGTLRVINRGTDEDGDSREAVGLARHQEGEPAGALEVTFVPPYTHFFSDYRILYVTPDYSGALVSDAEGDNLWVLERSNQSDPYVLDELLFEAEKRGFDTDNLIYGNATGHEGYSEAEVYTD